MIPNLMYMMKVSKSVESGFTYVLGLTSEIIQKDFTDHFKIQYANDILNTLNPNENKVNIRSKKHRIYRQSKINPEGTKIAYCEHYLGQYKVKIFELKKMNIKLL